MKLHTKLSSHEVSDCFMTMVNSEKITRDVHMIQFKYENSNSHLYGFYIQLGTYEKDSLPKDYRDQHGHKMNVRRFKNTGERGADEVWAATYDEWGWFINEIMARDPQAKFGQYDGAESFHRQTRNRFRGDAELQDAIENGSFIEANAAEDELDRRHGNN